MTDGPAGTPHRRPLAIALFVEVVLAPSYLVRDAGFHWLTHLFTGGAMALLVLLALALTGRRPTVGAAVVAAVAGHVVAAFPDVLFAFGLAHAGWMDVFALHLSSHDAPGGLWGLWLAFAAASLLCAGAVREPPVPSPE